MHDTAQYIQSFDIALLTETRCASSDLFPAFQQFSLPVSEPGRAGHGVSVLVSPLLQKGVSLWKAQPEVPALWVRLSASTFGLDKDLFMASVYLPPGGSQQLQCSSVTDRFHHLSHAVGDALQHGYVILGGDFNAKVAARNDVAISDMEYMHESGMAVHRGMCSPKENLHGRLLTDLCVGSGLLLGTGRLLGDMAASPTFFRGSSGSRLDHFAMDRCTLSRASDCTIQQDRYDSDHKPLVLSLSFQAAAAAAAEAGSSDIPGQPLPSLRWDGSKQGAYVRCLNHSGAQLAECEDLVNSGDVAAAFQKLGDTLVGSARMAGCKHVDGSRPPRCQRRDKPYFDRECKQMRAQFRYAMRHDPQHVRVLARRFSFTIRRKCRQYRQRQTPALLRHLRSNHKCFWQQLNRAEGALPAPLASHAAWDAFHQRLCAPPATRMRPPDNPCPVSPPSCAALEADISQREVEQALPKLSNGKASGGAGWPAELLRHAAECITMDNGSRQKVWILAPLLTRLLSRCFRSGSLPPCIASALVTPIHKKGCTLDTANYRPIAVGEPLYRLYTIILNRRLVDWSEENQLRSPTQAGFRPRQSPIHHLFALRHFIDTACFAKRPLYACFVDLQKAYDTVQHDMLWSKLESIGVGPRMLAAIQSLYSSGTLSMKVAGTAGQPRAQQMGVRQGCPLSPTLFGVFFDGLHDHLQSCAPAAGMQLGSGRWVSSLVYADDVVLLSWSPSGLQLLLDSMNGFCLGLGLVISPTKTEVVVFNGPGTPGSWHVGSQILPQSSSFKYLGLVFHESGGLSPALKRLAQNAVGARAQLQAKFRRLMCDKSVPMMRRLFDALVMPTVSYGAEIWGTLCSHPLPPDIKQMADVQVSFLRQLCRLRRSVTPAIIFRELAEKPWVHRWWCQVLGFMHRLSNMPQSSIHVDILRDNISAAQQHPMCGNWAAGIVRQYAGLGMPSPFSSSGVVALNSLGGKRAAPQSLGWSACVPEACSVQGSQAVHILCMVPSPRPVGC